MQPPLIRTRQRRYRRHASSKVFRSVLLSMGLGSLALAPVLCVCGVLLGSRRLLVYAAWYVAFAATVLSARWVLLAIRQRRKRVARRRRAAATVTGAEALGP